MRNFADIKTINPNRVRNDSSSQARNLERGYDGEVLLISQARVRPHCFAYWIWKTKMVHDTLNSYRNL